MKHCSSLGRSFLSSPVSCQVLVIGAGPAGSSAAHAAAAAGAQVILIERRRSIGVPPQCAGYIPAALKLKLDLPSHVVSQKVKTMVTHLPGGGIEEIEALGYIVHRDRLDQYLAARARDAGAVIFCSTRALSYHRLSGRNHVSRVTSAAVTAATSKPQQQGQAQFAAEDAAATQAVITCKSQGSPFFIKAAVVIGADGPRSTAGAWVNEQNIDFIRACQWTVPLKGHLESIHILFDRRLAGGYGWLFPKGDKANVGVGVDPQFGLKPAQELKWFASTLAKMKLIELRILATAGGLIPVGGPLTSRKGNLLLAGDAAGHCHPMTGAGVTTAVQCGELAGKAAARAALSGDFSNLDSYKSEVEELAGDMLRRAVQARQFLEPFWAGPEPQLREALRYSWVSFPEYGNAELCFTFADRP